MHLAVAFDLGMGGREQLVGAAHLQRRGPRAGAEHRVTDEGQLGRQTEAAHLFAGHRGDVGQLLGRRVVVDEGVGQEERHLVQHQRVHRGELAGAGMQADEVAHLLQVAVELADQAADHRVGIAELQRQRADRGVGAAHRRLGHLGRHAVALHALVIGLPVLAEARVVLGVDDGDVLAQLQAQPGPLDARRQHGGATDQRGPGEALVQRHLHRAQHPLVLALGIDDAGRRGLGGREHRAHEHAGLVDEALQRLAIGGQVGHRARGHAVGRRGRRHSGCDAQDQPRIEGLGDQIVRAEGQLLAGVGGGHFVRGLGLGQRGDLAHAGQLHALGDLGRAAVQRAAEDVGEAQDVVDLVGIVRPAGGHDAVRPHGLGQLGPDLGLGVGQGQDDGLVGHVADHVGRQHAGR
mmetsp:Transcript_6694/g.28042  ORF Transcript_6694/g.28042 Transcript_6694/m.28042 type:complete len:406 (-) Transcript_6694:2611-3828(-)